MTLSQLRPSIRLWPAAAGGVGFLLLVLVASGWASTRGEDAAPFGPADPERLRDVQLLPYHVFDLYERIEPTGDETFERITRRHTEAELPWATTSIARQSPPQGFTESSETVRFELAGEVHEGQRVTWTRGPESGGPRLPVRRVRLWISNHVDVPPFVIPVRGTEDLPVPAGCVRIGVDPLRVEMPGVPEAQLEQTFALTASYEQPTYFQLGANTLEAHQLVYTMMRPGQMLDVSVVLSGEMPGGVCSLQAQIQGGAGAGNYTAHVHRVQGAPIPQDLLPVPGAPFAVSPPAGFIPTPPQNAGELARFVDQTGQSVRVGLIDLRDEGLQGYLDRTDRLAEAGTIVPLSGISHEPHIAGAESLSFLHRPSGSGYVVTQYAGQGVMVIIDDMIELSPAEVTQMLRGWRWLTPRRTAAAEGT